MNRLFTSTLLVVTLLILSAFKLDNAIVPKEEILSGGPPKDGIPAILKPKFLQGSEANFPNPSDQIIGVEIDGQARAYPIGILNWHEVVNDTINGVPVVVTF